MIGIRLVVHNIGEGHRREPADLLLIFGKIFIFVDFVLMKHQIGMHPVDPGLPQHLHRWRQKGDVPLADRNLRG
ncbi:hypothetical protein D1872_209800 [compost metagenome]